MTSSYEFVVLRRRGDAWHWSIVCLIEQKLNPAELALCLAFMSDAQLSASRET